METSSTVSKWLIRLYALAILVLVLGDILEGGEFALTISLLILLIITQTFLLPSRNVETESEQDEDGEVAEDQTL